jgi:hypothetical protein
LKKNSREESKKEEKKEEINTAEAIIETLVDTEGDIYNGNIYVFRHFSQTGESKTIIRSHSDAFGNDSSTISPLSDEIETKTVKNTITTKRSLTHDLQKRRISHEESKINVRPEHISKKGYIVIKNNVGSFTVYNNKKINFYAQQKTDSWVLNNFFYVYLNWIIYQKAIIIQ